MSTAGWHRLYWYPPVAEIPEPRCELLTTSTLVLMTAVMGPVADPPTVKAGTKFEIVNAMPRAYASFT